MKRVFTYLFLALLFLAGSCSLEKAEGDMRVELVDFRIRTAALSHEVPLRLIVADGPSGRILINDYPLNLSTPYELTVPTGQLHVYVLGNEPTRLTPSFESARNESALSAFTSTFEELPEIESPENSEEESNLPLMKKVPIRVRAKTSDPQQGEASMDGGTNWSSTLDIALERLPAKVSLGLRKNTPVPGDVVKVDRVEIINIPLYAYWVGQQYRSADFSAPGTPYENAEGILFSGNDNTALPDNYRTVFEHFIVPKYILSNAADPQSALLIRIYAQYNQNRVIYRIPVRGDLAVEDYSLSRNKHYIVRATIESPGEIIYMPEVEYAVADWEDAINGFDIGKSITFDAGWTAGTKVTDQDVRVLNNEVLNYEFMLTHPPGASWTATITNPIDFMFDYSNGAVSGGITEQGQWYNIRIRPRRETSRNDVYTEFYITVNNGSQNIELDLPAEQVGGGHRYRITQIPN